MRRFNDPLAELKSLVKLRILIMLLSLGEATPTQIRRTLGLSYSTVTRHIDELKSLGIVSERRFGRVRVFTVNVDRYQFDNIFFRLLDCLKSSLT